MGRRKTEEASYSDEPVQESKPVKRAKTKAEQPDSTMATLAERTAIAKLGKAMYIGAHVSAAGGRCLLQRSDVIMDRRANSISPQVYRIR